MEPIFWLSPSRAKQFQLFDGIHPAISYGKPVSVNVKGYRRFGDGYKANRLSLFLGSMRRGQPR